MKNLKKLLSVLLLFFSIILLSPEQVSGAWKKDSNGWLSYNNKWYYLASSGAMKTGWIYDNGNWYYTYSDGTMARNTSIGAYYLNNDGAWTTSIPATSYNSGNGGTSANSGETKYVDSNGNGLIKGSKSYIYHLPGGTYYDKTTNVIQWFKTTKEAEAAGYRAAEK